MEEGGLFEQSSIQSVDDIKLTAAWI